jgi:hypothetical protein
VSRYARRRELKKQLIWVNDKRLLNDESSN